ncbi:MAG: hypothetical protein ABIX01_08570 [Chitinophagaceae bacterium]
MPTANSNRISATITPEKLTQLHAAFDTIDAIFEPFAVGLSAAERASLPKINDANKTFAGDALLGAQQNTNLLPGYIQVGEMQKDMDLYQQLDAFVVRTSQLAVKMADTQMLAGSEAYVTALIIYKLSESASAAGVPGANALYQNLKHRFSGQGNFSTPAQETKPTA